MRVLGFVGVNWFNRETDCGSVTSVGLMALSSAAKRKTQFVSVKGIYLVMGSVVDQVGVRSMRSRCAPVFTMFGLLMAL